MSFPLNLLDRFFSAHRDPIEAEGLRAVMLEDWPEDSDILRQWEQLAGGPEYVFFHTPLWQRAVWKHVRPRGRPHVILVWKAQQLVGVLPLQFAGKSGYQTPAPHITDYLDPLFAPQSLPCAAEMILRLLGGHEPLTLNNVRPDAPTLAAWSTAAARQGWAMEQFPVEQCPLLALPGDAEQWMDRLQPHIRKELRRKIRKVMEKGGGRLEECPPDQAEAGIERLVGLMQHRGQKAQDVRRTLGPILREAGPTLIRQGRLRLSTLFVEGRPAACILESFTPAGPMLYNSGFDTSMKPWSPGLVAVALSIHRAIEHGCAQYDFMRGVEPYKYDLGALDRPLLRLILRAE